MSLKVYKASAGSGKTFQLALEYIALALESGSPTAFANILAVTFTNKATGEMKDRILAQLYNLAQGGTDHAFAERIQERLKLDAAEIKSRASRTLHSIVHNYDRFRVETIDSFFQSLLTGLAHELNLSRGFSVDLDTDQVVSRAVDRMILSVGRSNRTSARVAGLVLSYMEEQIEDDKGWNVSKELKAFARKNLFGDEYLHNEARLEKVLGDREQLENLKNQLRRQADELKGPLHEMATELERLLASKSGSADPKELKSYKSLRDFALDMLKDKFETEPNVTMLKATADSKALLNKKLQTDEDYLLLANKVSALLEPMNAIREEILPFTATADLMLQKIVPLCLLNEIGREVTRINAENGTFMLAKTPDFFNKMVEKEDASFIFERTGTTFRHVLIDEFQDTSRLQWNNFKRLLVENMAQGDECMLVGDIKQSIYRWRGGDWEILGRIAREMDYLGDVEVHTLDHNFRSCPEIIAFNNRFFELATRLLDQANENDRFDSSQLITHIYEDVAQKAADKQGGGYVRVCIPDKKMSNEEVMEDVYEQIRLLREKNIPYEKMGILVRQKKQAVQLIDYFSAQHPDLPLTSDEAFLLSASPAVMLLVHALKYLSNEADSVALEVCRKMAETLRQSGHTSVEWSAEELNAHRKEWTHTPLFELCRLLIRFFKLPEAEAGGCGQSAYLFSFLDKVLAYLESNSSDLAAFTEYWDDTLHEQAIAVDIKDSVYIMTIHKSKGLERHTILIPFCNWELDKNREDDILWCETAGLPAPFNTLPLVPVKTHKGAKVRSSAFAPAYLKEHLMQRIDSINELYVAFTRARENMLIWSQPARINNTVQKLVDAFIKQEEAAAAPDGTPKAPAEAGKVPFVKTYGVLKAYESKKKEDTGNPLDTSRARKVGVTLTEESVAVEFKQSNRAKDFISDLNETAAREALSGSDGTNADKQAQEQASYIDRGKLLHYLFSKICTPDDVPQALKALLQEGLISSPNEAQTLQRLISKRLAHPLAATWFDGSWKLFAECNLLIRNKAGITEELRPDRVMMRDEETVVVDYKFGKFNEDYVTQVQNYMNALRKMGRKDVKGYLWFMYSGEVREVV